MANSMYADLDGTNFPDRVDSWEKFLDPTASSQAAINAYYGCINGGDFDGAAQILASNPQLNQMIINAKRMNQIRDAIIALERFFDDNVYDYIVDVVKDGGTWSSVKTYKKYTVVDYTVKGAKLYYMAIQDVPLNIPPTETSYWKCITLQGERGVSGLGLSPRGAWSSSVKYTKDDFVAYNNALWAASVDNQNQPPVTDSSYWYLIMDIRDVYSEDMIITVPVANWTGDAEPYINRVKVADMKSSTSPVYGLVPASTTATKDELDSYSCITDMVCEDGYVTLYADKKPTMTLTIIIKGFMSKTSGVSINDVSSLIQDVESLNEMVGKLNYSVDTSDIAKTNVNVSGASMVIYNNQIHVLGADANHTGHYTFNPSTGNFSKVSTMPFLFQNGAAVVYNGKIHALGGADSKLHYAWDSSSGWKSIDTLPYVFENGCAVVYNNAIHILGGSGDSTGHFQSDNDGKWNRYSTIPIDLVNGVAEVIGGNIYIFASGSTMTYNNGWGSYEDLGVDMTGASSGVFDNAVILFNGNKVYSYKREKLSIVLTDNNNFINSICVAVNNTFYIFGINNSYTQYKSYAFSSLDVASKFDAVNEKLDSTNTRINDLSKTVSDNKKDADTNLNKKADKSVVKTTTLSASSWIGNEAPFSISVPMSGVTTTNIVECTTPSNITKTQIEAYINAAIINGTQTTDNITLKAWGTKPEIDLPLTVIIRGDV